MHAVCAGGKEWKTQPPVTHLNATTGRCYEKESTVYCYSIEMSRAVAVPVQGCLETGSPSSGVHATFQVFHKKMGPVRKVDVWV